MTYDIKKARSYTNIAEELEEDFVKELGSDIIEAVESDEDSRSQWMDDQDEWLKLAAQVRTTKSFPWNGASNVKYPLMTIACLQFHARALPSLVNSSQPVMARVIGRDKDGQKLARANRVRTYMSYQVMEEMEEWINEMDRMLFVLPMIGLTYKKTYYSETLERLKSVLILPKDLIVNYHAQDYDRARMTHVLNMDLNEIIELQRDGLFLDVELSAPENRDLDSLRDEVTGLSRPAPSDDDPHRILEVHGWWDLDDDGYKEPYIITVHADTRQVLRIVARWDKKGIKFKDGEVQKITATNFFTPYVFLPDPNSAVYGLGFGSLLGPTNEATNTIINQLIDAGTRNNLQGGFLARGAKIKGGITRFKPGEWKIVNASGTDLKSSIVPLPTSEPSSTLMALLQLLISSGERIGSVSEMMVGENPGQNQKATTTMAVLEQGLKVFTGIYQRIFRQMKEEFKKIYYLNGMYLDEKQYKLILDHEIEKELDEIRQQASPEEIQAVEQELERQNAEVTAKKDFDPEGIDILPAADPNLVTESQKMVKSQALLEKLGAGLPLNVGEVTRRALEAEQHEDIEALMTLPPQPPSIEERQFQLDVERLQKETLDSVFTALEKVAKAESLEAGTQLDQYRAVVEDMIKVHDAERGANENTQAAGGTNTPAQ